MYTCKAFEVFVSLSKIRSLRSEPYAFEHLIITWARLFIKWSLNEEVRASAYFMAALESFFNLFSSIERVEEFPNLDNFESELSKALFELLTKLEEYPYENQAFKGLKGILFRWAIQMMPESNELKTIITKFMSCFMDDRLVLKASSREDIFEAPAICKTVKKLISH
jgi:hypothetical protein